MIKRLLILLIIPTLAFGQNITPPSNVDTTVVNATSIGIIWNSAVDNDIPEPSLFGYFISPTGDDSNDGTSQLTPWQTLAKVQTELDAETFDGDSIFFEKDGRFDGVLTITDSNLYFGAYGTGADPLITGLDTLTGTWVEISTNLWAIPLTETEVRYLYRDGAKNLWGREPNTGFNYMHPTDATNRFRAGVNDTDGTWDSAYVVSALFYEWGWATRLIEEYVDDTIYLASAVNYGFNDSLGYIFINHVNTLDQQDEWAFNTFGDTLWTYSTTNPNSSVYEYSAEDILVNIDNSYNLEFNGIDFSSANQIGIDANTSNDLIIDGCGFINMPEGILGIYTDNIKIKRNDLRDISDIGVRVRGVDGAEIDSNTLNRIAINEVETDDEAYGGSLNGIETTYQVSSANYAENVKIRHNVIDSIGYRGINIITTSNYDIGYNHISNACYWKLDGGGVYAWHNSNTHMPVYSPGTVYNNWIEKGQTGRATEPRDPGVNTTYTSFAFYWDDGNSTATFNDNYLEGHRHGFYLHNSDSMTYSRNFLVSNQLYGFRFRDDGINPKNITNLTLYNNKMVWNPPALELGFGIWAQGNPMPILTSYTSDSNKFSMVDDQYNPIYERDVVYTYDLAATEEYLTAEEYQSGYGGSNEKVIPFTYNLTELSDVDSTIFSGFNYTNSNYQISDDFWDGYYFFDLEGSQVTSESVAPFTGYAYLVSKTLAVFPPDSAQNFNALSYGKDSLTVTASNFDQTTDSVRILYAYDNYPANRTDGTLLYAGDTNITEEYSIDVADDTIVYVGMFSGSSNDLWSSANIDTAAIDSTGFTEVTIFENHFTDSTEWSYTQGLWRFQYEAGDSTAQFLDVSTTPLRYNMTLPANTNLKFTFNISSANTTARFAFTDNSEVIIVNYDNYAEGTHEVYGTTDANGGTAIMIYGSSGSPDVWDITYLKIETQ